MGASRSPGTAQAGVNGARAPSWDEDHGFETVKPLKLFEKIIQLWCPADGLVLDPFAGSGTTGHAVLDLNAESGAAAAVHPDRAGPAREWRLLRALAHGRPPAARGQRRLGEREAASRSAAASGFARSRRRSTRRRS